MNHHRQTDDDGTFYGDRFYERIIVLNIQYVEDADDVVGTTQESNVTSADGLFIEMISAESNSLVARHITTLHKTAF